MNNYLQEIQRYFTDTNSSEHSYRTTFENYLKEIFPAKDGYFTQQDQRAISGNKPDFVILKNNIPVLYIEVKKVGEDLDKIEKSNQADRYFGYDNLIISDYVDFRFFRNGQKYGENIALADCNNKNRTLHPKKEIETLTRTIIDFIKEHKEPIKRGKHLAQIMGGKAQRIRDNVRDMLESGKESYIDLIKMQNVVRENLISNLDNESFADMYAQTLVYGLFAARYNDKSPDNFSRTEARELVPKTNPFLRSFFDHIAGNTFPDRLRFIVDELCEAFSHADVHKLLYDFYGTEKDSKDPIIHFYEDFLKEYDSKKKMDMGVFYTPKPVVQFIVRAVDSILKSEFGLAKGLSDTTKISIDTKEVDPKSGKEKKVSKEYHKVQVLDVATGTGTFLNEVINHIHGDFIRQEGRWSSYVKNDLLPRLHGFELMMASYTIAHLKLGMTLHDSGVTDLTQRLGVYLTNTLEAPVDYSNQNTLFGIMDSIADEAKNASRVKSEYPIMCVIGNPPYAISSSNKGEWIQDKLEDYKKGLNEKKINIDDDYIKFIRFAQYMVDKNGEGIVAYISNNSFIDGITHRKMRQSLLKSFNSIYILDLHGNARKKETSPDGSRDQNVFDIMQGVSINIFVKKKDKKESELGKVYHVDLYGDRNSKYESLDQGIFEDMKWNKLQYSEPYYFFVPKDFSENVEYEKGFKISEFFIKNSSGLKTERDELCIKLNEDDIKQVIHNFQVLSEEELKNKYHLYDSRDWKILFAKKDIIENEGVYKKVLFRVFDERFSYITGTSRGFMGTPGKMSKIMSSTLSNIALLSSKSFSGTYFDRIFITDKPADIHSASDQSYVFPLYLHTDQNEKVPNLNKEIWDKINEIVSGTTPENILDYIYAVLHSPTYREKYKEFLKIDFPRVPYPESKERFFALAKLGEKLRELHLMTDPSINDFITTFPNAGSDEVEKIKFEKHLEAHEKVTGERGNLNRADIGDVWINNEQYFGDVPEIAWNFYIGGYQPAQKYLKDRKGRKLTNDEIEQYQRIIKVLIETEKIMREIDMI